MVLEDFLKSLGHSKELNAMVMASLESIASKS